MESDGIGADLLRIEEIEIGEAGVLVRDVEGGGDQVRRVDRVIERGERIVAFAARFVIGERKRDDRTFAHVVLDGFQHEQPVLDDRARRN